MPYLSRENITLVIALFGALGTIVTWIFNFINNKKNIVFSIVSACYMKRTLSAYIIIENKSRMPICINGVEIVKEKRKSICKQMPTKILEITTRTGSEVTSKKEIYSYKFPITLGALSGDSGYIFFNTLDFDIDPKEELVFVIATNRGKKLHVKITPKYVENISDLY